MVELEGDPVVVEPAPASAATLDEELRGILGEIANHAADLVGARLAVLGVLDQSDRTQWVQQVTSGPAVTTEPDRASSPSDVLERLVDDPRPWRHAEARPVGASTRGPTREPQLGVPITVRGHAAGGLYVTGKAGGDHFTDTDERILVSLASTASLAVQNARLSAEAHRREQWLESVSGITTQLLTGAPLAAVLPQVVRQVRTMAAADFVILAVPQAGSTLHVVASDGLATDLFADIRIPPAAMSAHVLRDGVPIAVADAQQDPRVWKDLLAGHDVGPALFVPLGTAGDALGVLVVAGASGRPPFGARVLGLVEAFAGQAAVALRLGAAAADREQIAVLSDRDRIARDLHDLVIQRLFATGMTLEGTVRSLTPENAERVRGCVDDLDETIKEIRTTIFALQSPAPHVGEGVRAALLQAVHGAVDALGFRPSLIFEGPVDTVVLPRVGEQMLAVVREALSNVVRHARATAVAVSVHADADRVELVVADNGVGLPADGRRSGLLNLAVRAADLGGTFSTEDGDPVGTTVRWTVPLP